MIQSLFHYAIVEVMSTSLVRGLKKPVKKPDQGELKKEKIMYIRVLTIVIIGIMVMSGCASPTPTLPPPTPTSLLPNATMLPPTATPLPPTATSIPPTITPTPEPTLTSTPEVATLFKCDFEDNTMCGFTITSGGKKAKILADETSNKVLEVKQDKSDNFQASFGPKNINNFDLTFRTRFIEISSADHPIFQLLMDNSYVMFPVQVFNGFALMEVQQNGSASTKIVYPQQPISPNVWYKIHIVSQGTNFSLSVNDGNPMLAQTKEISKANLGIQVYSTADIQFDDFVITEAKK